MREKAKNTIHIIYSIVLSIMLAVAGICLMVACVGIYNSGDRPFTPESVATAFSGIAIPVYICLALLFGGFLLDIALPLPAKKRTAIRQDAALLKKLHHKFSIDKSNPSFDAIAKEQAKRRLHRIIAAVLLSAGSIVFLIYGTNPANFHQTDITGSMKSAMYVLLPCMAIPFGYSIFAAYASAASIKRETKLLKLAVSDDVVLPGEAPKCKVHLPWLRYALLAFAVAIMVYGYFAGGTNDVLTKAINICTECVGLG